MLAGRKLTAYRVLSPGEAARLAARLANEESARRYHRQPFQAGQNAAVLRDGWYSWGGLNEGARSGFSALVSFDARGQDARVEVFFSSDEETTSPDIPAIPFDDISDGPDGTGF